MRLVSKSVIAVALAMLIPPVIGAQGQDAAKPVAGGGVSVPGWTGKIDASEEKAGQVLNNSKLAGDAKTMSVTTGPAVSYWNPANKAAGNYTVKATFNEAKFMNVNNHAHPYGIFIGGSDMGTADQSYLYCAAYGNGNFIVRGFGPAFDERPARRSAASVNKAAAKGEPVKQEIALSVKGDRVECAINGTVVAGYSKADLVVAGKLKSTDGIYGIRFAHNTEATVTGLSMTKD